MTQVTQVCELSRVLNRRECTGPWASWLPSYKIWTSVQKNLEVDRKVHIMWKIK